MKLTKYLKSHFVTLILALCASSLILSHFLSSAVQTPTTKTAPKAIPKAYKAPTLTSPIMDLAGVLTAAQRQQLESKLLNISHSNKAQIAVLILSSLQGSSIEEVSIKTTDAWKLGKKGSDKGVLIVIAVAEKKFRIEVGRGLEGTLTDLKAAHILREQMAPQFKVKNYYAGIDASVNKIMKIISGDTTDDPTVNETTDIGNVWIVSFILVFLIVVILIASAAEQGDGRRGRRGGGGGWGGGGFFGGGGGGGGFSGGGGGFSGGGSSGDW